MGTTRQFWLATTAIFVALSGKALAADATVSGTTVETVVVTAEKRAEPLNNVPASVSALEGSQLRQVGATSITDFAALVPGVTFQGSGSGVTSPIIRGIGTGGQSAGAVVGLLIDGVPYGSSTSFAEGGQAVLDSSLWDIDRVEVLRGPQSTLYGASGMTGLLSYVYKLPNLTDYEVNGEATASSTKDGEATYAIRGAVSIPIVSDELGLRISGSHETDGGYIDNTTARKKDANRDNFDSARATLLYQPNDDLSVKLEGMYQHARRDTGDYVIYNLATKRPAAGQLSNSGLLEPLKTTFVQGAATIDYNLGWSKITSISAYQSEKFDFDEDFTNTGTGALLKGLGAANTLADVFPSTKKFTEELRLASNVDGPLKYLAGFFYDHEKSTNGQLLNGFDAAGSPSPFNPFLTVDQPSHYTEYAFFGQATYSVTDRLDLTGGIRYSHDSQNYMDTNGGLLGGLVPNVPLTKTSESQVSYLGTALFKLTDTSNVYGRASSGYRPGGPDPNVPGSPTSFGPDKLWNYEVGYKGTLLDGRVDLQVDGFYVTWKNIQVESATAGGFGFIANGKNAVSRGIEAQGTFIPFEGMTVSANIDYTDAHLVDAVPEVGGSAGERLPNSPRWSGALIADYNFPLWTDGTGFVGGTLRAVGSRTTNFNGLPTTPQFPLASYALVDLRAGVESDNWRLSVFIHNLGDERAELSALTTTELAIGGAAVEIARPRTFGITLDAHL